MDKRKLQHFIKASNEDFADAHEPVNDGVKKVPNANDIAQQVGRSGEGGESDITKQGEATIIEEQADDEDAGTEMTEQVTTDNDANDIVEETETTETETPVEDEPELAHDDVKSVETDEKIVTKEKEALEAFVPIIRRAELIGYTKRQTQELGQAIRTIRAKSGIRGPVTVSAESIHESIDAADAHLVKLAKKRKYLQYRVSVENLVEPVVNPQNEAPLAHEGATPLPAAQGLAVTEAELGPVVDTVIEEQASQDLLNEIGQLQAAGVAIEGYTQLIRENKGRLSKQTAAIIHAGLEHIDNVCKLRKRSTGLENFDTTPRMAMESTDIDETSLGQRARDIGAKILNLLVQLIDQFSIYTQKFTGGIAPLIKQANELEASLRSLKGELPAVTLSSAPAVLFEGNAFVGDKLTPEERDAPKTIANNRKLIMGRVIGPLVAALKNKASEEMVNEIRMISDKLVGEFGEKVISIPGGAGVVLRGASIELDKTISNRTGMYKAEDHTNFDVSAIDSNLAANNVKEIAKYLDSLDDTATATEMNSMGRKVKDAVITMRRMSKDVDEDILQRVQHNVTIAIMNVFSPTNYFKFLGDLAAIQKGRLVYYTGRLKGSSNEM